MKSKYYNKETVTYKFKLEILSKDEYATVNNEQKKILWEIFLITLKDIKKISAHQAKTWKYPEKLLK